MVPYTLTQHAEADLVGIAHYTLHQWGAVQSLRYADLLEQGFCAIAAGTNYFREPLEHYPALRVSHCEHHYVFYLYRDNHPPKIIAVLHEKMDLLTHVKQRLA